MRATAMLALAAALLWSSSASMAEPAPPLKFADPADCPITPAERIDLQPETTDPGPGGRDMRLREALPEGTPASPSVEREIAAIVDAFFACVATHDPERVTPFFGAAYLRRRGLAQTPAASPEPAPQSVATLGAPPTPYAGPWRVQVLPDGRVAALVWLASDDPDPAPGKTLLWILTNEGGNWRIDAIIDKIAPRDAKFPTYVADLVEPAFPATPVPPHGP
ncbi:MAG TPA: hypothetical protein VFI22_08050 [Thermomicrobiales bacterium]|nr:hypothetical protein [Thermomicrobiales bacterium]